MSGGVRTSGGVLAALTLVWAGLVWNAPLDATQGVVQKILYVHVPAAFSAYLGFALTAIFGALYLWRPQERFDRVAAAGAEVGVLFCTLNIASGPIWAKATWGHWWRRSCWTGSWCWYRRWTRGHILTDTLEGPLDHLIRTFLLRRRRRCRCGSRSWRRRCIGSGLGSRCRRVLIAHPL